MRTRLDAVLADNGGAISRAQAMQVISRNQLDDEIARGRLKAPFPRAYCRPWDLDLAPVLRRAALASVGDPVALSHLTALAGYLLWTESGNDLHVTVPAYRHPTGSTPGLTVHRTRTPTRTRVVDSCCTVEPAVAVVSSWPLIPESERRGPAITAVRRGIVTPVRLHQVCAAAPGLSGRRELTGLIGLLAAGCESELEIWGMLNVFDVPGLRHGIRQRIVKVGPRTYRLDLAFDAERVAIELDGDRFHSTPEQREADRHRDAALAAAGWLTLRFTWRRLHHDAAGCRRDALATLEARRVWRRSG